MCRFSTICFTKFGTNFSQLSGSQTSPVPCKMQACWFGYVRKINLKRKKSQGSEIKRSRARLYPRVHLCMPQNRGRRIKREKKKNLDKQMCSRKTLMIKWNPQKKTKFRRINGKTKTLTKNKCTAGCSAPISREASADCEGSHAKWRDFSLSHKGNGSRWWIF